MTWRQVVELMTDYLEGALSAVDRARFEEHRDMGGHGQLLLVPLDLFPEPAHGEDLPGHRVSDFPHAAIYTGSLAEFEASPSAMRWILEIHVRDPKGRFGAFFEDMLLSDDYYA